MVRKEALKGESIMRCVYLVRPPIILLGYQKQFLNTFIKSPSTSLR